MANAIAFETTSLCDIALCSGILSESAFYTSKTNEDWDTAFRDMFDERLDT